LNLRNTKGKPQMRGQQLRKKPNNKKPITSQPTIILKKQKQADIDVEKECTRKVDLDYIPGLDTDELKIILPGMLFLYHMFMIN
jgi:hypothetical protein